MTLASDADDHTQSIAARALRDKGKL
jgi:hypothetical protein